MATSRAEITIMPDGSATTSSSSTTLVIHPEGGSTSTVVTSSGSVSSSFASSSSTQMSKSVSQSASATTTKSVKQTTTTSKTVKSSTSVMKSSSTKTSSSKAISIKSNTSSFSDTFGKQFGIDVDAEMKKLMAGANEEVQSIREKFFKLQPLALTSSGTDLIKLDNTSINDYIDKANNDRVKFNFDVTEFESESIHVKSDGNKIEVHAKKRSKKGDDETNEEYSRTYELPTSSELNPEKVTSSFFKDGVLTIELPVADAVGSA